MNKFMIFFGFFVICITYAFLLFSADLLICFLPGHYCEWGGYGVLLQILINIVFSVVIIFIALFVKFSSQSLKNSIQRVVIYFSIVFFSMLPVLYPCLFGGGCVPIDHYMRYLSCAAIGVIFAKLFIFWSEYSKKNSEQRRRID